MSKILSVSSLGEDMLDLRLDSGSILLLNLAPLLNEGRFAGLLEDDRILYPKTDGDSVFWKDGPKLTLNQILELAQNTTISIRRAGQPEV